MSTAWVKIFFWGYLLFLVWVIATVANPADPDLWHLLALGEAIVKTGHFPPGEAFSYLADYHEVLDFEWGSGVIFYALYQGIGPGALVGFKVVALGSTLALLVGSGLTQRKPSAMLAAFYAVIILALGPSFASTLRSAIFTDFLLALWLYWFQVERHGRATPLWFYGATMVFWANVHAGFVIGLGWLAFVAVAEWVRGGPARLWVIRFLLCLVATLVNPFGWRLWWSTVRAIVVTRQGFAEWEPVDWLASPLSYAGYKVLLLGLLAAVAIQFYRRRVGRMDRFVLIVLGAFAAFSLTSARHTSLLAVAAGAFVPGLFRPSRALRAFRQPPERLGKMALRSVLVLVPLYSALIVLPGEGLELTYSDASCPTGSVMFLKDKKIHGNLLVPFNYGSYALWELRGQMRVSMDGRYELAYRPETYHRVDDFFRGTGNWESLLTTPAPAAILVPRSADVYDKLRHEPGWREAWHDPWDAVFLPQ